MVVVTVRVVSKPETREQTLAALVGLEGPTRDEAGCQEYAWYTSATNPDEFLSVERWDSAEHVSAHMQTSHVQAVLAAAGEMVVEAPAFTTHEVSSTSHA